VELDELVGDNSTRNEREDHGRPQQPLPPAAGSGVTDARRWCCRHPRDDGIRRSLLR
jgi:hypothetical protein